ncbi:MAG TPA: pyridoxine 5'-phosphate synthase [Tepidisphaeraceae bacterium]|jgi:pyridoxine 5-phosphate synthase|nr:pyridoxine 5'-phosphate synthase [Tepidisphaeraceae bacterium]
MTKLSVNVNKICTIRNTRPNLNIPDLVHLSKLCLSAGCHGLTVHPRPDHRHIRPDDVYALAKLLRNYPGAEFNIEGNPFHDYLHYAREVRPTQCTLVPDTIAQSTSDHGWDLTRDSGRLRPIVEELKSLGIRVSVFMDPLPEQMELAKQLGVDRVELYTEPYAAAFACNDPAAARSYTATARQAVERGLSLNAGHDLNLQNLRPFLQVVPNIQEVSIGHALIADALEFGLAQTIQKYLEACKK